jgi:predicted transcriptional regulator
MGNGFHPKLGDSQMAKTVNYTPEQTELMVGMYVGVRDESEARRAEVVAEIAEMLGKNERSVRAKLSREGVYVAKAVVSKVTKGEPAKKLELAEQIATFVAKVNPETLAKAGKTDLVAILAAVRPVDAEAEAEAEAEVARVEAEAEAAIELVEA